MREQRREKKGLWNEMQREDGSGGHPHPRPKVLRVGARLSV